MDRGDVEILSRVNSGACEREFSSPYKVYLRVRVRRRMRMRARVRVPSSGGIQVTVRGLAPFVYEFTSTLARDPAHSIAKNS